MYHKFTEAGLKLLYKSPNAYVVKAYGDSIKVLELDCETENLKIQIKDGIYTFIQSHDGLFAIRQISAFASAHPLLARMAFLGHHIQLKATVRDIPSLISLSETNNFDDPYIRSAGEIIILNNQVFAWNLKSGAFRRNENHYTEVGFAPSKFCTYACFEYLFNSGVIHLLFNENGTLKDAKQVKRELILEQMIRLKTCVLTENEDICDEASGFLLNVQKYLDHFNLEEIFEPLVSLSFTSKTVSTPQLRDQSELDEVQLTQELKAKLKTSHSHQTLYPV